MLHVLFLSSLQAPTLEVKEFWVKEIKKVLMGQFDEIKSEYSQQMGKLPSTQGEVLTMSILLLNFKFNG